MHDYDADAINLANSAKNRKIAEIMVKDSVKDQGAETYKVKQSYERVSKKNFKKAIKNFLVFLSIIMFLFGIGEIVVDKGIRNHELNKANQYMITKMVSYLEKNDVSYSLTDGSKVIILEGDKEKLSNLCEMMEQDGFTREESFYSIYKTGGEESLDKVAFTAGYESADHFVFDNYRDPEKQSADYKRFENNVEVGYVENVKQLISGEQNKLENSKGIGL